MNGFSEGRSQDIEIPSSVLDLVKARVADLSEVLRWTDAIVLLLRLRSRGALLFRWIKELLRTRAPPGIQVQGGRIDVDLAGYVIIFHHPAGRSRAVAQGVSIEF